ncbi:hypothetical protein V5799_023664, partial [Amblyomma americanum]
MGTGSLRQASGVERVKRRTLADRGRHAALLSAPTRASCLLRAESMKPLERFRKVFRAAVVSVAVFLTFTRPACTYLSNEDRRLAGMTPLADALPASHSAAYDASDEEYDQEPPSVIRDYSLEQNTYSKDGELSKLEFPRRNHIEQACLAYADKATCKQIIARHSKIELKDKTRILRMLGKAALANYKHRLSKARNLQANNIATRKLYEILSKAELGKAGQHGARNDDFGFKLTDQASKQRSGDNVLSRRMQDELTRRSGNFGLSRNS